MSATGIGVGFRPELSRDLFAWAGSGLTLELVLEDRLASPERAREGVALAEAFPIALHGTKVSLGSAEGLDAERVRRLARYARESRAAVVTEHAAFVRSGGVEIGHLTALPFSRDAARAVARNADRLRRALPDVPLLLENVAWGLRPPGDEMDEGEFHCLLTELTGCGLLLDLANLAANAHNAGVDPFELLARYPVERAEMIHIAGGVERCGFFYDTHAHAVPDVVFGLLERALERCGAVDVILERDDDLSWSSLQPELARAEAIAANAKRRPAGARRGSASPRAATACAADLAPLASQQDELARWLAGLSVPPAPLLRPVLRAREVLVHKRVQEALPLLPRLRGAPEVQALARAHVSLAVRPSRAAPVADARAIAAAAARSPHLADAAALDGLALDARFCFDHRGASPRRGPFVGSVPTSRGRCFAARAPGAEARARFFFPRQVWDRTRPPRPNRAEGRSEAAPQTHAR